MKWMQIAYMCVDANWWRTRGRLKKNVILEASGASEYFWRALEGLTAVIQYDQQCANVLV